MFGIVLKWINGNTQGIKFILYNNIRIRKYLHTISNASN